MTEQRPFRILTSYQVLLAIFGVLMPSATIAIEASTGLCAEVFFDPLPSLWHLILVSLVPLINLTTLLGLRGGHYKHYRKMLIANGLAMGIAIFYSLLFLPLLPLALLATIIYGMGLLPLTPLSGLVCSIVGHCFLKKALREQGLPRGGAAWPGLVMALVLLLLLGLPTTITGIGMRMAASSSPVKQQDGLHLLRNYGDNETMLRACYQRPQIVTDLINLIFNTVAKITPGQAREIYYRTTGKSFDTVAPPRLSGLRSDSMGREFDFDPTQGEPNIGQQIKGLIMTGSRLDGSLDAAAALGYLEWTMVFKNKNPWIAREARARILLPPGACVSRLTLWVNGEEREAAFSSRGKVREAYQKIVRRQRDPVLVTMQGPDRVMMQCFPVPSDGKEMKVRLGITCPLRLLGQDKAALHLPCFIERNFSIPGNVTHSLWIEAKHPLAMDSDKLKCEHPADKNYALRGPIGDRWLASPAAIITIERPAAITETWAPLPQSNAIIRQTLRQGQRPPISCVVLVVDTSVHMRPYLESIAASLTALPTDIDFAVIAAGDEVKEVVQRQPANADLYRQATERIRRMQCIGGIDSVPALVHACQVAAKSQAGLNFIVWMHGPQPVLLQSPELLRQNWERRPNGPVLYELSLIRGQQFGLTPVARSAANQASSQRRKSSCRLATVVCRAVPEKPMLGNDTRKASGQASQQ